MLLRLTKRLQKELCVVIVIHKGMYFEIVRRRTKTEGFNLLMLFLLVVVPRNSQL